MDKQRRRQGWWPPALSWRWLLGCVTSAESLSLSGPGSVPAEGSGCRPGEGWGPFCPWILSWDLGQLGTSFPWAQRGSQPHFGGAGGVQRLNPRGGAAAGESLPGGRGLCGPTLICICCPSSQSLSEAGGPRPGIGCLSQVGTRAPGLRSELRGLSPGRGYGQGHGQGHRQVHGSGSRGGRPVPPARGPAAAPRLRAGSPGASWTHEGFLQGSGGQRRKDALRFCAGLRNISFSFCLGLLLSRKTDLSPRAAAGTLGPDPCPALSSIGQPSAL